MTRLSTLIVALLISGCTSWAEWPHENFKHNYGSDVGRKADDPSALIARYPQLIVAKRDLPNGNSEIEFLHAKTSIRDAKCVVFYEVAEKRCQGQFLTPKKVSEKRCRKKGVRDNF